MYRQGGARRPTARKAGKYIREHLGSQCMLEAIFNCPLRNADLSYLTMNIKVMKK